MTKFQRIEFNKDTLYIYLTNMNKKEIVELIEYSFTKPQMIDAVKLIFSQAHPATYDNMERFIYKRLKNETNRTGDEA